MRVPLEVYLNMTGDRGSFIIPLMPQRKERKNDSMSVVQEGSDFNHIPRLVLAGQGCSEQHNLPSKPPQAFLGPGESAHFIRFIFKVVSLSKQPFFSKLSQLFNMFTNSKLLEKISMLLDHATC